MDVMTAHAERAMIGGGELGRCPTRIHHDRFTEAEHAPDPVAQRRIEDGRRWERTVVDRLLDGSDASLVHAPTDLVDRSRPVTIASHVPAAEREAITRELLRAGVPLIVGGRLAQPSTRSVGAPDVIVRLNDGYAPIDVKHHKVVGARGIPARATPLDRLTDTGGARTAFRTARVNDLLQVAHYWSLLDDAGCATPRKLVGVIGSDPQSVCLWTELDAGRPSIAARYRDALDAAVRVVDAGGANPAQPLVPAMWRGECRACPWAPLCRAELEAADHVSLLRAVTPDAALRLEVAGVSTTSEIEEMSDASLLSLEVPTEARIQARARSAGAMIRRRDADLTLPSASVEIDFDVETHRGLLYLAGLLTTDGDGARFEPIADWSGTVDGERRVVTELFDFFDRVAGQDAVVYHWTSYERTVLRAAAERHGLALRSASSVDTWFDRHAVDLHGWVKHRFVSPDGYSLKAIAPLCGFAWRDADPGGAQSELWYEDLLAGDDSQRLRLLAYNEDDVAAQLAIRRWVAAQ
jgi:hypothetical protein